MSTRGSSSLGFDLQLCSMGVLLGCKLASQSLLGCQKHTSNDSRLILSQILQLQYLENTLIFQILNIESFVKIVLNPLYVFYLNTSQYDIININQTSQNNVSFSVDKQGMICFALSESNPLYSFGELLIPISRGLFQTID